MRRALEVAAVAFLAVALLLGGRAYFVVASADLSAPAQGPVFFDRHGEPIRAHQRHLQKELGLSEISPYLVKAVIASEDARFYRHPGIDPISIVRALRANLFGDGPLQGASTITQQVAKNLFLTPERTLSRKLEEAILAFALEARFSKDRILEIYLNRAYFGEGAYGAEAAARLYFGKGAADLNLSEAALLAGLLPAPNRFSPYRNPQVAQARRDRVLERMLELGLIDAQEFETARASAPVLANRYAGDAPYFIDYVIDELVRSLGSPLTFHGRLEVHTTLDLEVQRQAEAALGQHQGAVVVLDLATGDILAMVGGRDYRESQFNRATQARRQPGSAFKPFIYAAALERGWTLASLLEDTPRRFGDYEPSNWNDRYWGSVTMKEAMAHSLNLGSVWLLSQIGTHAAIEMAHRVGLSDVTWEDRHLALALGGVSRGVTPLNLARAYTPFATGGLLLKPRSIIRVRDATGREWPLPQQAVEKERVLSPEVAYLVTDMLRYVVEEGTGTGARLAGVPAAGKTGSTNGMRDAWFIGYTPNYLAAVYIGDDDNRSLPGGGGALAAPVWRKVMEGKLASAAPADFPVPPGVITGVPIDASTGLLAGPECPAQHPTAFVEGTEPHQWAPCAFVRRDGEEPDAIESPAEEEERPDGEDQNGGPGGLWFWRNLIPFLEGQHVRPEGEKREPEASAPAGGPAEETHEGDGEAEEDAAAGDTVSDDENAPAPVSGAETS